MRKLILGKIGIGKTTFLVKKIIPKLKDYLVFDFCKEYGSISPEVKHIQISGAGVEMKKSVSEIVLKTPKQTTLIFDNAGLLYAASSETLDSGYHWLTELLERRKCIMVFHSPLQFHHTSLREYFSDIILFPTRDIPKNDISFQWYIEQLTNGTKVGYMQHFTSALYKSKPYYI